MRTTLSFLTCMCIIFFGLKAQNTEWQTDLEEGLRLAKEENKNVLVEFGVVQDGTPLFIADDVWTDEVILTKLGSFIPVSIDLAEKANLSVQIDLRYAPTIALLTPKGDLIFKTEGFKDVFELDEVLGTMQNGVRKIVQLSVLFNEDDQLGNLLLLEEYIKTSIQAPTMLKENFLDEALKMEAKMEGKTATFDPVQSQRFTILKTVLNSMRFTEASDIRKLKKIGKKDLYSSNHSLLLFALSYLEYADGDERNAYNAYTELVKRLGTDKQAAIFIDMLENSLGFKKP